MEFERNSASAFLGPKLIKFAIGLGIFFVLFFIFKPFKIISAGERGIILTWGAVSDVVLDEGLHFFVPIAQKIIDIDVKTQKVEADAMASSKDLQIVTTRIALNYHLDVGSVNRLWQEIGRNYKERIIDPAIQEAIKEVTAKYTAVELITKRPEVKDDVKNVLSERLKATYIVVDEVSIVNFRFSSSFDAAIEMKVTAEQEALAAKNRLEQIKFEAQQRIETAKGKAEAITIEARALKQNPDILELRAIEKWNGVLPKVTGGAVPFINIE